MKSFSLTDVGKKRKVNQDYVYQSNVPVGVLPNLYMVADGMGGHQAGDYASKLAVEIVRGEIERYELQGQHQEPEQILVEAIKAANREVLKAASLDEHYAGMGTTLVVATVIDEMLYFANVGDSRLYVINEEITQLSQDHSLVEEMVRLGGIKPEEAKNHPDKNIITRAVGTKKSVDVDYFEHTLKKDDKILMCSDGLSNMVEDDGIFEIVKCSRDIVEGVIQLVEKANENGGKDNIGVVLLEPILDGVNLC